MIDKVFIPISNDKVFYNEEYAHWISKECKEWLKELEKGSGVHLIWLHEEKCIGCSFHFDNKSDAILFKLVWS